MIRTAVAAKLKQGLQKLTPKKHQNDKVFISE
jgi:hypothetical protein